MADKKIIYTQNDVAIVNALKNAPEGLTIAQVSAITGLDLKPGHFTSLCKNKGLIEVIGDCEVEKPGKRKVKTYTLVTSEFAVIDGKACNYSDVEKNLLVAAATFEGRPFTLGELAAAAGYEKLVAGNISGLTKKKGNFAIVGDTLVDTIKKTPANVYGFVKDIPEGAEVR